MGIRYLPLRDKIAVEVGEKVDNSRHLGFYPGCLFFGRIPT
jgi:hypothetical protein